MAEASKRFTPDYAVSPGDVLEEWLETHGLSHAEFARRCGRSAKLIGEIVAGTAPVLPDTALRFEKVLGMDATIWLGIETDYRLRRAREAEAAAAAEGAEWAKAFPIRELAKRGCARRPESKADRVSALLTFFGVGSTEAWRARYGRLSVAYRHSPSFQSDDAALATWLRLGELEAESQQCADYDKGAFRRAAKEIRALTRAPIGEAVESARRLCNGAGVALAPIEPFPKMAVSGAARWLSPRKAAIQLSARHKTDDHFWFGFFHEAAHILLHSKKHTFVDGARRGAEGIEAEANAWASDTLVPRRDWKRFVALSPRSKQEISAFADRQGIAPGIVVGMLQHEGVVPWTHLNCLKTRLEWAAGERRASAS